MVGDEDDDGVLPQLVALEGVEQQADLGIDEADAGVVGLGVGPAQGIVFLVELKSEGVEAGLWGHAAI